VVAGEVPIQRDVEEARLSSEINRWQVRRDGMQGRTIFGRTRMRPGFSVTRKRPLGNSATAQGLSRPAAMVVTAMSVVL